MNLRSRTRLLKKLHWMISEGIRVVYLAGYSTRQEQSGRKIYLKFLDEKERKYASD
jgi:hypothetical protein